MSTVMRVRCPPSTANCGAALAGLVKGSVEGGPLRGEEARGEAGNLRMWGGAVAVRITVGAEGTVVIRCVGGEGRGEGESPPPPPALAR